MAQIVLGLDFDNTIACYDGVFQLAAREKALIGEEVGSSKDAIRDYLRKANREDEWTELQGFVYGARMDQASVFDGATEAMQGLLGSGVRLLVISHKTLHPFMGPKYDLHAAARDFLEGRNIAGSKNSLLGNESVFFELTLLEKLVCIAEQRCTHFLDDLPEVLNHPQFPAGVKPILFDPQNQHAAQVHLERILSWRELPSRILGRAA
jgi:hypothetical protein